MKNTMARKEPLFHITRRPAMSKIVSLLIRVAAFFVAIALSSLFVLITIGVDPITFIRTMLKGSFGITGIEKADSFSSFFNIFSTSYFWTTLKTACKLLIIAVALAPAFKMRFWNIGAEGQILAGGMGAAFIMYNYSTLPIYIILPLMFIVSIICGAIWGTIPAIFKAKFNTNETLFTLMMNYIAMKIVDFFVNKWRGPMSALGMINRQTQAGWLRSIWNGQERAWFRNEDLYFMLFIILITVLMYFYLRFTKQGYEISVVGDSQNTAKYAGISVNKVMLRTMAISGGLCGLCGFLCVSAQSHTINSNLGGGYGFTAIIVAWLSKFNSFIMIAVSILIVALENGSSQMANTYGDLGFSAASAKIIVGIMMLMIIGSEFFINYKIMFRSRSSKKESEEVSA